MMFRNELIENSIFKIVFHNLKITLSRPDMLHLYLMSKSTIALQLLVRKCGGGWCDITPWQWFSGANIEATRPLFTYTLHRCYTTPHRHTNIHL